jgi:hypothetical protein
LHAFISLCAYPHLDHPVLFALLNSIMDRLLTL